MIEHFLFLIFGKLEYADEGERDIQYYRVGPHPLADVQLLHECVDAVTEVHESTLQLHHLLSQTVNYNAHLLQLVDWAQLALPRRKWGVVSEGLPRASHLVLFVLFLALECKLHALRRILCLLLRFCEGSRLLG